MKRYKYGFLYATSPNHVVFVEADYPRVKTEYKDMIEAFFELGESGWLVVQALDDGGNSCHTFVKEVE